ncbi:unnamed protein product, partial [Closterium sp. NIES-54]
LGSTASYRFWNESEGVEVEGRGWAHEEKNWGAYFPAGHVWMQGMSSDNSVQLVGAGAFFRFTSLPSVPSPLVLSLGLRTPHHSLDFRSIDPLTSFSPPTVDSCSGRFSLAARTPNAALRVRVHAAPSSFSRAVWMPRADGDWDATGRESFSAVMEIELEVWGDGEGKGEGKGEEGKGDEEGRGSSGGVTGGGWLVGGDSGLVKLGIACPVAMTTVRFVLRGGGAQYYIVVVASLVLLLLADGPAATHARILPYVLPYPGLLKCALTANLEADLAPGGGERAADARLDILVYSYRGKTNVKVHIHYESPSGVAPTGQSIHKGQIGSSSEPIWTIDGDWTVEDPGEWDLSVWYMGARKAMPAGSSKSVYSMLKKIDRAWFRRSFYVLVKTAAYPNGALRGQIRRAVPFSLIPWSRC